MVKKADTQLIKLMNEIQLLKLIREAGPVSRIELARSTHMSKVAVFDIINRLIEAGMVLDVGKGESTSKGGKRPSLVKLDPTNHYVIGVEFKRTEVRIAVGDIEASIVDKRKLNFKAGTSGTEIINRVFKKIDVILKKNKIDSDKLVSVGIGIPGLIDYDKGRLSFADTLQHWDQISLAESFEKEYNKPVILDNDVNAITIGESILGAGRNVDHLFCLWIGQGVGSGLVIENRIVKGLHGAAGEIGYLEIQQFGETLSRLKFLFNNQKYFGDILREATLEDCLIKAIKRNRDVDTKKLTLDQILKNKKYEPVIRAILDEYASILAMLCLNIIKVINPELIILSGRVIENSGYLLDRVKELVKEKTTDLPFLDTTIVPGELKDEAGLRGAIAMALQVIFETSHAVRRS